MQSRTEMRQNLPRGYFKKRKYDTKNVRPPDKLPQTSSFSFNFQSFVNIRTYWTVLLVLILCVAKGDTTTIEPNLNVVALSQSKMNENPVIQEENGYKSKQTDIFKTYSFFIALN